MCIHKPEGLSYEEAAGIPESWITATQALWIVGSFKPSDKVLSTRIPMRWSQIVNCV
jgi:NADPH:quinone reductase-like Zn-dependent oxidoreductase